MSTLVGELKVDVVSGQASFVLDDAKSQLDSFGKKAKDVSGQVDYSMNEARHSVMMLGEEFGVHLPRGLTTFIASLGPIGPALEAAFPFLAVAIGATLLIQHMSKIHDASEKLTEDQLKYSTTVNTVFGNLKDKLTEAQIKADELAGHHLDAVNKQLQLIDHSSMKELVQSLDEIQKAADAVFADIDAHNVFSRLGAGADGAKDALKTFKTQYDDLIAKGDTKGAEGLLTGTLARAKEILALQEKANKSQHENSSSTDTLAAIRELQRQGIADTDEALAGQRQLVKSLQDEVTARQIIAQTGSTEKGNVLAKDAKDTEHAWDTVLKGLVKKAAEANDKFRKDQAEMADAAMKATDAVNAELSKTPKTFNVVTGQVEAQQTLISNFREYLGLQQDALEQSHALGLTSEKDYYTKLRVVYHQEHEAKMAAIQNQIDETSDPDKKVQLQQHLTEETIRYNSELAKVDTSLAKISASWTNYFGRMRTETQDLSTQIRGTLQSAITQFNASFSQSMAKSIVESRSLGQATRQVAAQILESMLSTIIKIGVQWLELHTMKGLLDKLDSAQQIATATATTAALKALAASLAGSNAIASFSLAPWPIDTGAPAFGASMAAAALAMAEGGIVPGYGNGDTVPAMLTPGEMVLPKPISQTVQSLTQGGGAKGGDTHHHWTFAPQVTATDDEGVDRLLKEHGDKFHEHAMALLRKRNTH